MPERITSRQNTRIKNAAKLRSARHRAAQRRFLVDGLREISRALDAEIQVAEAFYCPKLCDSAEANQLVTRLNEETSRVAEVSEEVFAKLCFGERTEGVVIVADVPERSLATLQLPPQPIVAVLAELEKPGNVGAILRTADGAGIDAVIVTDGRTDLFNPNTIRASLGTVFSDNVCETTFDETLALLRRLQLPILATRPEADALYTKVDYRQGAAIVLGSEAAGLSETWARGKIHPIRLPMHGTADSLNVSATAAVLFYEALRQREAG